MLLTAFENGFTQKNDALPQQWFADKPDNYLEAHLIPTDRHLGSSYQSDFKEILWCRLGALNSGFAGFEKVREKPIIHIKNSAQ